MIVVDFQYLQNVVFRFGKGSNGQSHSSSGFHYAIKSFPPSKFLSCPALQLIFLLMTDQEANSPLSKPKFN